MPAKVALIFVYNHRYDKNIAVLEAMYKERFSNIYHLVPFYNGDKVNVIPVYENSYYFQGYLAQGFKHYFNKEYDHYLFVADDLVLNPAINEHNYQEHFNVTATSSYIPEIFTLQHFTNNHTLRFSMQRSVLGNLKKLYWWRIKDVVKYNHKHEGLENEGEMPTAKEAHQLLSKHGYDVKPLSFYDVYGLFPAGLVKKEQRQQAMRFIYRSNRLKRKFHLAYPMVASYSDIVIVDKGAIKNFCHYCGVFASNHLFVECALPTALLLAGKKVVTEKDINRRGSVLWAYTSEEAVLYEAEMRRYNYDLNTLLQHFPEEKLYIHPIKLSQWTTTLQ